MDAKGQFYLGKIFDPASQQVGDQALLYDPVDLTTHAVVVGMTGSGKTGLCFDLLEEAALNGTPALMIDPKGDITNLLLHFPDLLEQDFQPWIDPDQARRDGKTIEQAAADAVAMFKKQMPAWGMDLERLRALKNSVRFAVYTPGSDAGISVSILASLKAPSIPWEGNREILREKITGTVTALLGLLGMQDIDPVRSREHILLSNIFEQAWSQGKDLDLGELIMQTQTPPFAKLGVFDVNTFFLEKDRFGLAMLLNNILAAPAFQTWIEGEPLDVQSLLYSPDGRPKHSIFYIAHLTEAERMFFVTLLFSAVESWMRGQSGTTSLRSLIYFDEIFGFMPPVGNPPAKEPMLRMLKQARAFGVGLVLVTQNPVDVDYKALSNAGTWFIGKLQTDQDKQRLLDGLQGATAGSMDRGEYDRLISTLGKRVFLLHNVHASRPQTFQTRWAMNYLAGPLTRMQIPQLNQLGGATEAPAAAAQLTPAPAVSQPPFTSFQAVPVSPAPSQPAAVPTAPAPIPPGPMPAPARPESTPGEFFSATRQSIPIGVKEYFLPNNLTFTEAFQAAGKPYPAEAFSQGLVYRPVIVAQASLRFLNRKYNLDYDLVKTALVKQPDRRGMIRWENFLTGGVDTTKLDDQPSPQAHFAALEVPFTDGKIINALEKDFLDWAYRAGQVSLHANEALKIYAGPQVSVADFRTSCAEAARQGRDAEVKKATTGFETKLTVLNEKLQREQRDLEQQQSELSQRKWEELGTDVENVLGLFGGRKSSRRISSSLSKRRQTEKAKGDVEDSRDTIQDLSKQVEALQKERDRVVAEINNRWGEMANQITEIPVVAQKKDILLDLFGVAWMPFHQVKIGAELIELPGYAAI